MVNDYLHSEEVIIVCECDNNSGVRLVLTFKRIIQIIPGSGEMNRSQLSFQSKNTSKSHLMFVISLNTQLTRLFYLTQFDLESECV